MIEKDEISKVYATQKPENVNRHTLKIIVETTQKIVGESWLELKGEEEIEKGCQDINTVIAEELVGKNPFYNPMIDNCLMKMKNTSEGTKIGQKALLGVSKAICRLNANHLKIPLYFYIGGISGSKMPYPLISLGEGQAILMKEVASMKERLKIMENVTDAISMIKMNDNSDDRNQKIRDLIEKNGLSMSQFDYVDLNKLIKENHVEVIDSNEANTITELIEKIRNTKMSGKLVILKEHMNTSDTFMADLSVGLNLQYIDFGEIKNENHVAKYARLTAIEEQIV